MALMSRLCVSSSARRASRVNRDNSTQFLIVLMEPGGDPRSWGGTRNLWRRSRHQTRLSGPSGGWGLQICHPWTGVPLDAGETSGKLPFLSLYVDADRYKPDASGRSPRGRRNAARLRLPAAGGGLLLRPVPARAFR